MQRGVPRITISRIRYKYAFLNMKTIYTIDWTDEIREWRASKGTQGVEGEWLAKGVTQDPDEKEDDCGCGSGCGCEKSE